MKDLYLLGWATFLSNLVLCLSLTLSLVCHRPLRSKFGLLHRGPELLARPQIRKREVLVDGLLAMVLDLALQFAGTTSVYVAAYVSLQDMYQLSSATAALPQYSAYAVALGYVGRLVGGALVGRKAFPEFAKLMQLMIALSVILGLIAASGASML